MKKLVSVLLCLTSVFLLSSCADTTSYCEDGHEFGEWIDVIVADCVDDGERYRECTLCPYYEEDFPKADETLHVFANWDVLMEATCGEDGEKVCSCEKCGVPTIETIPATGKHHYEDGACTECGDIDTSYMP